MNTLLWMMSSDGKLSLRSHFYQITSPFLAGYVNTGIPVTPNSLLDDLHWEYDLDVRYD